jgi:hypothetical protein
MLYDLGREGYDGYRYMTSFRYVISLYAQYRTDEISMHVYIYMPLPRATYIISLMFD